MRLQLLGATPRQIADDLGMQPASIRELIRHREYAAVRERVLERAYAGVDAEIQRQATEILKECSAEAALVLTEQLQSDDPITRYRAAVAVLDRTGYGPVKRKAVRQRLEMDPAMADVLREALSAVDRARGNLRAESDSGQARSASRTEPVPCPTAVP